MSFFKGYNSITSPLAAAVLSAGTLFAGSASAALLHFDMSNVYGSVANFSGGFDLNTDTQYISNVTAKGVAQYVELPFNTIVEDDGVADGSANFTLTTLDYHTYFEIPGFNTVMPGIVEGSPQLFGTEGYETQIFTMVRNDFIDATITVSRLPDPQVGTVPLPAGFPLLLAGLGAFWGVRRKQG